MIFSGKFLKVLNKFTSTCKRVFLAIVNKICERNRIDSHFHEIKLLSVIVEDEFDGTSTTVVYRFGGIDCLLSQLGTQLFRQAWGWCLGPTISRRVWVRVKLILLLR